jgi:hypothetical protein
MEEEKSTGILGFFEQYEELRYLEVKEYQLPSELAFLIAKVVRKDFESCHRHSTEYLNLNFEYFGAKRKKLRHLKDIDLDDEVIEYYAYNILPYQRYIACCFINCEILHDTQFRTFNLLETQLESFKEFAKKNCKGGRQEWDLVTLYDDNFICFIFDTKIRRVIFETNIEYSIDEFKDCQSCVLGDCH